MNGAAPQLTNSIDAILEDKDLMKMQVDRFPIYHVCPKCLAALLCGTAIRKNASTSPSGIGWGGNGTGRRVTWEFPLRTDSASWKFLESFIQFTSFCSSCTLPDNSQRVFWSSMSFRLAIVSKVELWNFRNSSISVRFCWWTSRKSCCWRHNSSCRILRSCSARAAWSSWRLTFSRYSAIIVCLCSSSRVLICAFELFCSSGCPDPSTILTVWMSSEKRCDTEIYWLIDISLSLSIRFPWSIEPYRRRRLTDWHAFWCAVIDLSSVCLCEHLAECHVIHVLVRGRDHEREGGLMSRWARRRSGRWAHNLWSSGKRSGCPHSFLRRSSTNFPWRSGCRAQGTARCGESRRRRTGRKSKGRRERSSQREFAMDYMEMVMERLSTRANEVWDDHQVWKTCALCASSQASVWTSSLVYLLRIVSCMLLCVFTFHLLCVMLTLGLIAHVVIVVFVVAIFTEFCCIGGILLTPPVGDSKLRWLLPNFEL